MKSSVVSALWRGSIETQSRNIGNVVRFMFFFFPLWDGKRFVDYIL